VQLEKAQILRRRRVGRPADEGRQCPHAPNVIVARLLGAAAHPHVLDHARPQRADGPVGRLGGYRGLLFRVEGCWTFDARERMPRSLRLTGHPLTSIAKNVPAVTPVLPRAGSFMGRRADIWRPRRALQDHRASKAAAVPLFKNSGTADRVWRDRSRSPSFVGQWTAANPATGMREEPRPRALSIRHASSRRSAPR
jgi:hypothetical protein